MVDRMLRMLQVRFDSQELQYQAHLECGTKSWSLAMSVECRSAHVQFLFSRLRQQLLQSRLQQLHGSPDWKKLSVLHGSMLLA